MTHVIKGNETTKAMITFDVTVQLNSKPWAEVFLDGVERKDLGQTPLSGVRVPIGGVKGRGKWNLIRCHQMRRAAKVNRVSRAVYFPHSAWNIASLGLDGHSSLIRRMERE